MAQSSSVTISPSTGAMLAGVAGGYDEIGVQRGWSSMWQHEQLALTFNVSDYPDLTEGKQLANPAGNMCTYNSQIVVMGGSAADCYWTVSLPKGFRMTGYELTLLNNLDGSTVNGMQIGRNDVSGGRRVAIEKRFYETGADFDETHALAQADVMPGYTNGTNNDTKEYVIKRESTSSDDMGNILYFVLRHTTTGFYGITIKSFKIFFTAEADFVENVAPLTPQEVSSEGTSFMNYEFTTQKVDIGELSPRTFSTGNTYLVYDYSQVNDLKADIVLYEDDAVRDGAVGENGLRGITATRNGDNYYYALKNNVYYVEAPTNAKTQNDKNVNIAYRITGARIKYNYGQAEEQHQYVYNDSREETTTEGPFDVSLIYYNRYNTYLNADGGAQTGSGYPVIWDGTYIRSAQDNGDRYLTDTRTYNNGSRYAEFTNDKTKAKKLTRDGNYFYYTEGTTRYYLRCTGDGGFRFQNNTGSLGTIVQASGGNTVTFTHTETIYEEKEVTIPAFTPSDYTIKVFKTTEPTTPQAGAYAANDYIEEVQVSAANTSGEILLENLNNDAIKFEITGLPEGRKALVTVELSMQPLNPYISRLDIVCHDPNLELTESLRKTMTQTFVSEDFAVRGGEFIFYVPVGFDNKVDENGNIVEVEQACTFTFENLNHSYGDNTYYDGSGTGHARYYLVRSKYEQENPSAYGSNPDADYKDKILAIISGTKKFKFSNAEDLDHSSTSASNVKYEEYPFSVATYQAQGGEFKELTLKNGENDIRYLFTADETRYNIAPTTTTEHRSYAFYTMNIQLITRTYQPRHEWVKVYDSTFYLEDGAEVTKPMYGLKLLTDQIDGKYGYLTSDQINRILNNNDDASYYGGEYTPTNDRPADITNKKQVLYIDASELQAVVYKSVVEEGAEPDLIQIRNQIGENGLFFLPEGVTFNADNFAYKSGSNFRTGENIILKDKCPFYSPYTITVSSPHYATYTRNITDNRYGKDALASIFLPFTLSLTDGKHTNDDGSCAFTVSQLNKGTNDVVEISNKNAADDYGIAYFKPLTAETTEANRPYMIKVEGEDVPADENISFIATQTGATINATPNTAEVITGTNFTGKLIKGDETEVKFNNQTTTFTNYGTFSGTNYDRTDNNVFYFANNMYHNLSDLLRKYNLLVYPFRGIYRYPKGTTSRDFSLKNIEVSFDEPDDDATGIDGNWKSEADLMIRTDKGSMTVTATKAQEISIYSANGTLAAKVNMQGGDTQTVNLPSGLYVVNNVKIGVK